jgi:glycosyltransferase involved in cell wall biosynthesis
MRIAFIAFSYRHENLRLLPWRHVYELSHYFSSLNHEVLVVTDGYPQLPKRGFLGGVPVIRLRHVKHFPPCNFSEIRKTLTEIDPDVVFWLMGLTGFFQKKLFETLGYDIVALIDSPIYWSYELIKNLGLISALRNAQVVLTNFVETLVPKYFIRSTLNVSDIKLVVTLSKRNKERLEKIGVNPDKLVSIPLGVDPSFLQRPSSLDVKKARSDACNGIDNCFLVTYFGPPLDLRGIDTLLLAAKQASEKFSSQRPLRVLILSRERKGEYHVQKERLVRHVNKLRLNKTVKLKHGLLSKDQIKAYIAASDLVVLPFKHVISDAPVVVMEAMSLGIPVVSTDVDGIPELLENKRGLILAAGDIRRLAEIIVYYSENTAELSEYGQRACNYMRNKFTWKDSSSAMLALLE